VRVPSQLLRQHVTVNTRGEDLGDGPTWGPGRRIRCRVDWGTRLEHTSQGEDVTVVGKLLIRPDVTIAAGDRVTVDGDARTVVEVTPIFGPGAKLAGRTVLIQ
jgi:hypothetical protein